MLNNHGYIFYENKYYSILQRAVISHQQNSKTQMRSYIRSDSTTPVKYRPTPCTRPDREPGPQLVLQYPEETRKTKTHKRTKSLVMPIFFNACFFFFDASCVLCVSTATISTSLCKSISPPRTGRLQYCFLKTQNIPFNKECTWSVWQNAHSLWAWCYTDE